MCNELNSQMLIPEGLYQRLKNTQEFSFEDVGAGRWLIGIAAGSFPGAAPGPGALSTLAHLVEVPGSGRLRLVVERGLNVRGQVQDSFGKPLAGAMIDPS